MPPSPLLAPCASSDPNPFLADSGCAAPVPLGEHHRAPKPTRGFTSRAGKRCLLLCPSKTHGFKHPQAGLSVLLCIDRGLTADRMLVIDLDPFQRDLGLCSAPGSPHQQCRGGSAHPLHQSTYNLVNMFFLWPQNGSTHGFLGGRNKAAVLKWPVP